MSILIKGMEMPKSCMLCPFCVEEADPANGEMCMVTGKLMPPCTRVRLEDCPLVPVPPHGDLIERDALRASIRESIEECHKWADEVDKDTMMYARISQSLGTFVECSLRVKAAPTIIPAEQAEEGE